MDITTGKGTWLFQAWNGRIPGADTVTSWTDSVKLVDSMWVDAPALRACLQQPGFCNGQIGGGEPSASYVGIRP